MHDLRSRIMKEEQKEIFHKLKEVTHKKRERRRTAMCIEWSFCSVMVIKRRRCKERMRNKRGLSFMLLPHILFVIFGRGSSSSFSSFFLRSRITIVAVWWWQSCTLQITRVLLNWFLTVTRFLFLFPLALFCLIGNTPFCACLRTHLQTF